MRFCFEHFWQFWQETDLSTPHFPPRTFPCPDIFPLIFERLRHSPFVVVAELLRYTHLTFSRYYDKIQRRGKRRVSQKREAKVRRGKRPKGICPGENVLHPYYVCLKQNRMRVFVQFGFSFTCRQTLSVKPLHQQFSAECTLQSAAGIKKPNLIDP